jgi:hypothetical protein
MAQPSMAERRAHPRLEVLAGVRFYHPASDRRIPGRTANVSRGGLWMFVPPQTPLRAGQSLQILELPPLSPEPGGPAAKSTPLAQPLEAVVIRVDRSQLASAGQIGVAVRFAETLA